MITTQRFLLRPLIADDVGNNYLSWLDTEESAYSRIGLVSHDGNVSICRNELEQAGVDYRFLFNVFNIFDGGRKLSDKEVSFIKENSSGFIPPELYRSALFKVLFKVATPFISLVVFLFLLVKYKVHQLDRIHKCCINTDTSI